jgi:putative acetyltransferase
VIIRQELSSDGPAIVSLHAAAFARGSVQAPEALLTRHLRETGDVIEALSLVATSDGVIVGHVACSRAHLDHRPTLGLAPLGVTPGHQRRGVGQALMHAVLAAADALCEPHVFLLGEPEYYRRFGFVPASSLSVQPPEAAWSDHFQVRTLRAWDGTGGGTFRYAPAFADL